MIKRRVAMSAMQCGYNRQYEADDPRRPTNILRHVTPCKRTLNRRGVDAGAPSLIAHDGVAKAASEAVICGQGHFDVW